MSEPVVVHVPSGAPYDVVVGRGLLDELVAAATLNPKGSAAAGASRIEACVRRAATSSRYPSQ